MIREWTVGELIAELHKYPADLGVILNSRDPKFAVSKDAAAVKTSAAHPQFVEFVFLDVRG